MGVIAEGFVAYAQPLIDSTDGSEDALNKALGLAQVCWNLALLPEGARDESIAKMQTTMNVEDDEFEVFRRDMLIPMIERHKEMYPMLHQRGSMNPSRQRPTLNQQVPVRTEKSPKTRRNVPCPCNSGRKFKHCCGRRV